VRAQSSSMTEPTPIPVSPQLKQRLEEARSIVQSLLLSQDNRDTLLQQTEQRISEREAALTTREQQLDSRESALDQREQTLKGREASQARTDQALAGLNGSLTNASTDLAKVHRPSAAVALWRGLALSAVGGLAGGLIDRSSLQGVELGAVIGAAGGVGWGVVEM